MALQDWYVYAFETVSGRMVAEIPFEQTPNFEYGINDPGSGSVMVPLGGNGMSAADVEELSQPWRWTWAVCYRDFLCQAGPVISEQMTDTQAYTEVTFAGIWKLLSKRILVPATFPGGNPATTDNDTTYTNLTYRQMAKEIVATSLARGSVPIVLPPDDPPGTQTQQYFGYDLNLVADALTNLTGLDGGPEIEFRPQFDPDQPGFLQWVMRIGSPRLGQLGAPWVWDYGPRGAVQELDFDRDGSTMTLSDYVRGSGSQYDLIVGNAQDLSLVDAGYPLLEDVNGDHTSVTDVPTATSFAQQWVSTFSTPVNTPSAQVRADGHDLAGRDTGSPTLDQVAVGDVATFVVQAHRRIPDGSYTYRIVGITQGTTPDTVGLTLQPVVGVS